jgi:L-malate glycosyltransferase
MGHRGNNLRVMILASGDLWAGAEAVVYELCSGLKYFTTAEVTAVFLNEGSLASRCREAGIPTHVIDERRHNFISITRQVIDLASYIQPQVIHSHRYKENLIAVLVKWFFKPVCLVSTVHGRFDYQGELKLKVLNLLNGFALSHAFSADVAVSYDLRNYLRKELQISESKIKCIVNGISTSNKVKIDLFTREIITVGSAGRLFLVKDYNLMVDIAKEVCKLKDKVQFLLAGDGPDMQQIRKKINRYNLNEKFKVLGHVQDMDRFYRSLDIYLNTSKHEGMPMTLIEAMSYGIPVVAPKLGGMQELITSNVDGILVDERNINSFSSAIINLIENSTAARSMAMKAREKIMREFSSRKMVIEYYELYQSLI